MSRPRSDWYNDDTPETAREIHYSERNYFTGLYDHNGAPIYRPREPLFGFDPNRWNDTAKKKKGKRC